MKNGACRAWYNQSEDCDFEKRESIQNVIKQERINDQVERLDNLTGKELSKLISKFYKTLSKAELLANMATSKKGVYNVEKFNQFKHKLAEQTVEEKYYE